MKTYNIFFYEAQSWNKSVIIVANNFIEAEEFLRGIIKKERSVFQVFPEEISIQKVYSEPFDIPGSEK